MIPKRAAQTAAAAAVMALAAACATNPTSAKSAPDVAVSAAPYTPDPSATLGWDTTNTADPETTANDTEETTDPDSPEGKLDAIADQKGWTVDDYDTPSAMVADICTTLDDLNADPDTEGSGNPAQWLVDGGHLTGDNGKVLKAGVPLLCPTWSKTVQSAVAGTYDHWYTDGKYEVGKDIKAGSYRTRGDLENCYWERLTRGGETIDNNFATAAREITVTVRSTDGMFTSESCGTWKPVK